MVFILCMMWHKDLITYLPKSWPIALESFTEQFFSYNDFYGFVSYMKSLYLLASVFRLFFYQFEGFFQKEKSSSDWECRICLAILQAGTGGCKMNRKPFSFPGHMLHHNSHLLWVTTVFLLIGKILFSKVKDYQKTDFWSSTHKNETTHLCMAVLTHFDNVTPPWFMTQVQNLR